MDESEHDQRGGDRRNRRPLDPHLARHRRAEQEGKDQQRVRDQEQDQPLQHIEAHHDVGGDQHEDAGQHQKRAPGVPMPIQEDHEQRRAEDHLPEHAQIRMIRKAPERELRFQHGDAEDAEADPHKDAGLSAVPQQQHRRPDEDRNDDPRERRKDHQRHAPADPDGSDADEARKIRGGKGYVGKAGGIAQNAVFRMVCRSGIAFRNVQGLARRAGVACGGKDGAIRIPHLDLSAAHGFPRHKQIRIVRNGENGRIPDALRVIAVRGLTVVDGNVAGYQLALFRDNDRLTGYIEIGQDHVHRTADHHIGKVVVVFKRAGTDQVDVRKVCVLAVLIEQAEGNAAGVLIRFVEFRARQHVAEHAEDVIHERVHSRASLRPVVLHGQHQAADGRQQVGRILLLHDADDGGLQRGVVPLAVLGDVQDHGQQQTHPEVQRRTVVRFHAERLPGNARTGVRKGLAHGGELRDRNEPVDPESPEVPVGRHDLRNKVHRVDDVEDVFIAALRRIQNCCGRCEGIGIDVLLREHAVAHQKSRGDVGNRRRAGKAGDPDFDVSFDAVGQDIARQAVDDELRRG